LGLTAPLFCIFLYLFPLNEKTSPDTLSKK
jgi:hypothetical protein